MEELRGSHISSLNLVLPRFVGGKGHLQQAVARRADRGWLQSGGNRFVTAFLGMRQRDGLQKLNRLNFRKHLLVDQAVATGFPIVAAMEFLRSIHGSDQLEGRSAERRVGKAWVSSVSQRRSL